ncbi:TPA: hypothetical protein MII50_24015 [Klebsiella pneumoniae]|nr:hypothetical protein B7D73_17045 [Klebsiella pneumoniae]HBX8744911.1 hypothetical protein [Klebsiella pneumoniae]
MLVYLIKKDQGLCLKSMVYLSLMVRVILAMALKFQLENLAKLLLEMTLKSVLKAQSSVIIMSNLVMVVCSLGMFLSWTLIFIKFIISKMKLLTKIVK